VDGLIATGLPSKLGPYRLASAGATASTGGGDVILHLPRGAGHRIVLIDVMGHGLNACAWAIAYSAIVRTVNHLAADISTSGFLTELAQIAWSEPALERAMATVLVVDLDDGGATVASAGHPHPILFGSSVVRSRTSTPLLGVLPPEPYETQRIELKPGERLAIFTDGLDPADVSAGGEPPSWFMDLAREATGSIEELSMNLNAAAEAALGPQPPDDWTFVLIEKTSIA
jgi:serine/threonine-protein kinase RsbW